MALCLAIFGCVSAPKRPAEPESFEAGGLPLAGTDRVALVVSGEVSSEDRASNTEVAGLAKGDALEVAQAFGEGFRGHLSQASIGLADDALLKDCVDGASRSTGTDAIVLAIPELLSDRCRAQVERLGLRYLVMMGGIRRTRSTFSVEAMGLGTEYSHTMRLRAQVFDVRTGAMVCERDRAEFGTSSWAVILIGGGLGGGPLPVFQMLDEAAYWKHGAWRLGYVVAGCFVQPVAEPTTPAIAVREAAESSPATAVPEVAESPDVAFPRATWWFKRTRRVPGRLVITAGGLVFFERLPSGGETAYAVSYSEVEDASLEYSDEHQAVLAIRRHDHSTEYFSVLQGESQTIDSEGTRFAYERFKERLAPRANGDATHPKPRE